jgi:hypothetical protein
MLLVGGLILLILAAKDAYGAGERTRICAGTSWSAQSAAARGLTTFA